MSSRVREDVAKKLVSAGLTPGALRLARAAIAGGGQVRAALDDQTRAVIDPAEIAADGRLEGLFLERLSVRGFRGIGALTEVRLDPEPGLVIVTGRNGTGKSSFAEALEYALTGEVRRLKAAQAAFRTDVVNLHEKTNDPSVEVDLRSRTSMFRLARPVSEALDGEASAVLNGLETTLAATGLESDLRKWRPLLSPSDLGSVSSRRPSELHDALVAGLGLELVDDAIEELARCRLDLRREIDDLAGGRVKVLSALDELGDDERALACAALVRSDPLDLDGLDAATTAEAVRQDALVAALHTLSAMSFPSSDSAAALAARLEDAAGAVASLQSADAEATQRLVALLKAALEHQGAQHDADRCPVCGQRARFDAEWRSATKATLAELEQSTAALTTATRNLTEAMHGARSLLPQAPPALSAAIEGLELEPTRAVWRDLHDELSNGSAGALIEALRDRLPSVAAHVGALREAAETRLEAVDRAWWPVRDQVRAWLTDARARSSHALNSVDVKSAEDHLKAAFKTLRSSEFTPVQEAAERMWNELCGESGMKLDGLVLEGAKTKRKLDASPSLGGTPSKGLGPMSHGQLNALALSLFLPRAMRANTPFKFVVIDDPVQAMDEIRVDKLATVLHTAAAQHQMQVIVLTHDDRLRTGADRLGLAFRAVAVTRTDDSRVTIVNSIHPADARLRDAGWLAKRGGAPVEVARRVVPVMCREAIEAASYSLYYRREDSSEDTWANSPATKARVSLALKGTYAWNDWWTRDAVDREVGTGTFDVIEQCNEGAHANLDANVTLDDLVQRAAVVVKSLRQRALNQ